MSRKLLPILLVPLLAGATFVQHAHNAERAAVERAGLDYVEALYEVDPSKIERSVREDLTKIGYFRHPETGLYGELRMDYRELYELAGRWNQEGRVDPRTARKEVIVLDLLDRTAVAKIVAHWGVDYLHLTKHEGRWMIVHVLWQSPPPDGWR